jgi:hypothetical protein
MTAETGRGLFPCSHTPVNPDRSTAGSVNPCGCGLYAKTSSLNSKTSCEPPRGTAEHLAILTIVSEASKALCTDEARTFVSRADFCRRALIAGAVVRDVPPFILVVSCAPQGMSRKPNLIVPMAEPTTVNRPIRANASTPSLSVVSAPTQSSTNVAPDARRQLANPLGRTRVTGNRDKRLRHQLKSCSAVV